MQSHVKGNTGRNAVPYMQVRGRLLDCELCCGEIRAAARGAKMQVRDKKEREKSFHVSGDNILGESWASSHNHVGGRALSRKKWGLVSLCVGHSFSATAVPTSRPHLALPASPLP